MKQHKKALKIIKKRRLSQGVAEQKSGLVWNEMKNLLV